MGKEKLHTSNDWLQSNVKKLKNTAGIQLLAYAIEDLYKKVEELQSKLCAIEERRRKE